jgi:hypothetical protein
MKIQPSPKAAASLPQPPVKGGKATQQSPLPDSAATRAGSPRQTSKLEPPPSEGANRSPTGVTTLAAHGAQLLQDGLKTSQEASSALVQVYKDAAGHALGAVTDAFDHIVLPALDATVLAGRAHADKGMGPLGPVLTERLAVGEAVSIQVEAGVTLPTEFTGAPNMKLDSGGTLSIRRVEARDAQDQPILDPATGQPATRLEVQLEYENRTGGAYEVEAGVNAGVTVGEQRVGLTAQAGAEVEAGIAPKTTLTTRLDPDDPASGATLANVLNSVTKMSGLDAVPGLAQALERAAGGPPPPAGNVIFESITRAVDLYAAASANATLDAGVRRAEDGASGLVQQIDPDAGKGLAGLFKLTAAALAASAGGEVGVETTRNGRTGEETLSFSVAGEANANATLLNQGVGVQGASKRSIDMVIKDGKLQGVNVTATFTKEEFDAVRNTVEDVYGRPLDEGFMADASSEDQVSVTMAVRPEVLAKVKRQLESGDPQEAQGAMQTLLGIGLRRSEVSLQEGSIQRTHREEFKLGIDFGASLLGKLESRYGITLGHEQQVRG